MLTHCRRARLLAYRVVTLQSDGKVTPSDSAAYRIAVTRLDQDSAEVLTEIIALTSPLRRLPLGRSATLDQLTARLGRRGLTGLFLDPLGANPQGVAS